MKKRVEKCEKMLEYIIERLDEGDSSSVMKSGPEEGEYIINGKNVMKIRVARPYYFGFYLLDMLFTKEELAKSLLYESKKSDKPALDPVRVNKVLWLVHKRYDHKDDWDEKTLISKLNQNCRDSAPRKIKQEKTIDNYPEISDSE